MPKRISSKLKDSNQIAAAVLAASTDEERPTDKTTLSRIMAEMGRKGGRIGGKRRMETISPARRKKIAKQAAKARWAKAKKKR